MEGQNSGGMRQWGQSRDSRVSRIHSFIRVCMCEFVGMIVIQKQSDLSNRVGRLER